MRPPLSLWLVEDRPDYTAVFADLVTYAPDPLTLSRSFSRYDEVVHLVEGAAPWSDPDLVLMDIELPGTDGIAATADFVGRYPDIPVVALTTHDSPDVVLRAFHAGASGYVLKDAPAERIFDAIYETHAGGMLMPPQVARHVTTFLVQQAMRPPSTLQTLAQREREVLQLVGDGLTREEVAKRLYISPHTVESHHKNIYRKLEAKNNVDAVAKALRLGLID
jgi:two-component system response regulator NreC